MTDEFPEFPPDKALVGKTVQHIEQAPDTDEGWLITFVDGTKLSFGFSGCEGSIKVEQ